MDATRKVNNPLLSAAGQGFSYDYFTSNALVVAVTPATPAVLSDENDPPKGEVDSFIGQSQADATLGPTGNVPISLAEEAKEPPPSQPPKQSYFTSILSSFPNLSLSTNKTEPPRTPTNQETSVSGTNSPYNSQGSNQPSSQPFYSPSSFPSAPSVTNSAPPLQAPSVTTLPPSGGSGPGSYRLGNQRRLKYAPPPDLTATTNKQASSVFPQYQPPPPTQSYFVPGAPPPLISPVDNPVSSPLLSASPSPAQTNSRQDSFRSSPVNATSHSLSQPQSIPGQIVEPATPQNTPANFSFSGFSNYRPTSQPPSGNNNVTSYFENANTPGLSQASLNSEKNFAPISAEQVTEKLEHLIAERKEDTVAADTATKSANQSVEKSESDLKPFEQIPNSVPLAHNFFDSTPIQQKVDSTSPLSFAKPPITGQAFSVPVYKPDPEPPSQSVNQNAVPLLAVNPLASQQALSYNPSLQPVNPPALQSPSSPPTLFTSALQSSSSSSIQRPFAVPATYSCASKPVNPPINQQPLSPPTTHQPSSGNLQASSFTNYFGEEPTYAKQETSSNLNTAKPQFTSVHSPLVPTREGNTNTNTLETAKTSVERGDKPGNELAEINLNERPFAQVPRDTKPVQPAPLISSFFDEPVQSKSDLNLPTGDFAQPPDSQHFFSSNAPFGPVPHFYTGQFQNTNLTGPQIFQPPVTATFNLQSDNLMVPPVPEPTGSATLSPTQMSVNSFNNRSSPDTVPPSLQNLAAGTTERRMQYRPVYHHWFYRKEVESKVIWRPFSMQDSLKLEEIHNSSDISPETRVPTDGGRYDVDILRRQRSPVYWTEDSNEVRRCSWFWKGATDARYSPYEENVATRLEEEYKQACSSNYWNRKVDLNNGEHIILHSPTLQVHYLQPSTPDLGTSWGASVGTSGRPRMVKRGVDEFHIEDGEPEKIDHLLFLVHGIGSVCDLKFRSVEEVVDDFRSISLQLMQSHYRTASEQGTVHRIEVLPISWHATLHSEDTGIDIKLKSITLKSIPKLRHFTNDTLLDILFYTSPIFCQTIMQTVGQELNRLFALFNDRNPDFSGGIYVGGHSLGSLILFDLLCHQRPPAEPKINREEDIEDDSDNDNVGPIKRIPAPLLKRRLSRKVSYVMGTAGTGQPYINYPHLNFQPKAFFALGSPIGMFVTVRGIDTLGENFVLPTCPAFFNIFHPFDPVAYRVESLINPDAQKFRPMLIPHHKGRKRMHLELKETMARVGADLKQKLLDSVRSTWNSVYQLAMFHKPDNQELEQEIDKVVEEQLSKPPSNLEQQNDDELTDLKVGKLNGGRRIDYVLQEAPFEYINEYIFALTSHVCYWESEDTMLLILKEIYSSMGVQTDVQPSQFMFERPSTPSRSSPSTSASNSKLSSPVTGMDPTAPIGNAVVGPPPTAGFVRKPNSQSKT